MASLFTLVMTDCGIGSTVHEHWEMTRAVVREKNNWPPVNWMRVLARWPLESELQGCCMVHPLCGLGNMYQKVENIVYSPIFAQT